MVVAAENSIDYWKQAFGRRLRGFFNTWAKGKYLRIYAPLVQVFTWAVDGNITHTAIVVRSLPSTALEEENSDGECLVNRTSGV